MRRHFKVNVTKLVRKSIKLWKQRWTSKWKILINRSSCGIDQLPSQPSVRERLQWTIYHSLDHGGISSLNEKYVYAIKFIFGFPWTISERPPPRLGFRHWIYVLIIPNKILLMSIHAELRIFYLDFISIFRWLASGSFGTADARLSFTPNPKIFFFLQKVKIARLEGTCSKEKCRINLFATRCVNAKCRLENNELQKSINSKISSSSLIPFQVAYHWLRVYTQACACRVLPQNDC